MVREQSRYLDILINWNFQEANPLFIWSIQNNGGRRSYTRYSFQLLKVKNCNVETNGRNSIQSTSQKYSIT